MKLKILFIVMLLSFFACKKTDSYSNNEEGNSSYYRDETEAYPDGTYCAAIDYYNPNTGTQNTYTLNVEVENNEVTVIQWPNGGWLDDSHFTPQVIESDGSCSFTSDRGYQYNIHITGSECSYIDEGKIKSDVEDYKIAVACPECGGEKDQNDEYCSSCVQLAKEYLENTCSQCSFQKSNYEDLCDYCYKKNHTCRVCGKIKEIFSSVEKICTDCVGAYEKSNWKYEN